MSFILLSLHPSEFQLFSAAPCSQVLWPSLEYYLCINPGAQGNHEKPDTTAGLGQRRAEACVCIRKEETDSKHICIR
jgi:hypothetical protein